MNFLGEFLGNKIADAVINSFEERIMKTRPVEEMIIPQKKEKKY